MEVFKCEASVPAAAFNKASADGNSGVLTVLITAVSGAGMILSPTDELDATANNKGIKKLFFS